MRLFKRTSELRIEKPFVGEFSKGKATRTTIRDLRVRFQISKHLGKEPNTATITIHNLAKRTRAEFMEKPIRVRLFAGHGGVNDLLCAGDMIWSGSSQPDGVTWETDLQLGDGQRAYKHARSSRTFKAGTSIEEVLGDVAGTMGLSIPKNIKEAKEFAKQFITGVTIEGPSQKEMTRLVGMTGHTHSVQNGRLQILTENGVTFVEAHRVAADTGMLGTPELGAPTEAGKRPVLKVRMRLAARINAGDPINMEAKNIKGLYKVQRIDHEGDTEGQAWYSNIEATRI